jgi:hypothetical protein
MTPMDDDDVKLLKAYLLKSFDKWLERNQVDADPSGPGRKLLLAVFSAGYFSGFRHASSGWKNHLSSIQEDLNLIQTAFLKPNKKN